MTTESEAEQHCQPQMKLSKEKHLTAMPASYCCLFLSLFRFVLFCFLRREHSFAIRRQDQKSQEQNLSCASKLCSGSQGARWAYRALHPPPPLPGTFHYGPKMYLRVSRTQSHLFPGQPLGCTGVKALCARAPSCLQSVGD